MFSHLKKYRVILVTGPHRSGTTIAANMIAHDTGHALVLEEEIEYRNLILLAMHAQSNYAPIVVQCPFLSGVIHDMEWLIDLDPTETLIVYMHRYRAHIIDSEDRAHKENGAKVNFEAVEPWLKKMYGADCHISDAKYAVWEDQRPLIANYVDLGYESLRGHPLWIENRDFHLRQTRHAA